MGISLFGLAALALAVAAVRAGSALAAVYRSSQTAQSAVSAVRRTLPVGSYVKPDGVFDTGGLDDTFGAGGRGQWEGHWADDGCAKQRCSSAQFAF